MPILKRPLSYRVIVPCVLARDKEGRVHVRYQNDVIDWLDDDQAEHWLPMCLVTPIEDRTVQTDADAIETPDSALLEPADPGGEPGDDDRVSRCVAALDDLGVDPNAGAPVARTALRVLGLHKFGNDTIAEAVRARKATLSRTASTQPQ